eukprot:7471335-Pyramimonas_sp.AAC.1
MRMTWTCVHTSMHAPSYNACCSQSTVNGRAIRMQGHWKAMPTLCERGAASENGQGWAEGEGCKGKAPHPHYAG